MFMRVGLHLSGKGAAVFVDELSGAVDSILSANVGPIFAVFVK